MTRFLRAQCHAARLHDGTDVVVKVRRAPRRTSAAASSPRGFEPPAALLRVFAFPPFFPRKTACPAFSRSCALTRSACSAVTSTPSRPSAASRSRRSCRCHPPPTVLPTVPPTVAADRAGVRRPPPLPYCFPYASPYRTPRAGVCPSRPSHSPGVSRKPYDLEAKGLEGVKVALSSVDESVALSSVDESVPLSSADESVALSSVDESVALSSADESAGDTSTPGTRALHADRLRVALRVGPSAGRRAPPRADAPARRRFFFVRRSSTSTARRSLTSSTTRWRCAVPRPPHSTARTRSSPHLVQSGRAPPPTSYKVNAHLTLPAPPGRRGRRARCARGCGAAARGGLRGSPGAH